jgi:hypothetical protein
VVNKNKNTKPTKQVKTAGDLTKMIEAAQQEYG